MAHGGCRPLVWVLACALLVLGLACKESTQSDPMTREPPIFDGSVAELDEAIQEAELVFEGEVISIEYANSTNNGQGELDPDADGTEDRGELPHTFVERRWASVQVMAQTVSSASSMDATVSAPT